VDTPHFYFAFSHASLPVGVGLDSTASSKSLSHSANFTTSAVSFRFSVDYRNPLAQYKQQRTKVNLLLDHIGSVPVLKGFADFCRSLVPRAPAEAAVRLGYFWFCSLLLHW